MSDTPRTDDNAGRFTNPYPFHINIEEGEFVRADFARELERECNRYKELLEHIVIASKKFSHPATKSLVMATFAEAAFEKPDTNQPNQ